MITIRRSSDRGHAEHGWLSTYHTFSFADYFDPRYIGFRALRVINEDRIQPSQGFPTHGHQDMEILTYVLDGELAHCDSLGNGSVIRPGDVQIMSAGTGIRHSEFNHSAARPVHLLQIWIEPDARGLTPSYQQKYFPPERRQGRLCLLASREGFEDSLIINQDVKIYSAILHKDQEIVHKISHGRHCWLQVARGETWVEGEKLSAGDGLAASTELSLTVGESADGNCEILLFDLA